MDNKIQAQSYDIFQIRKNGRTGFHNQTCLKSKNLDEVCNCVDDHIINNTLQSLRNIRPILILIILKMFCFLYIVLLKFVLL